MRTASAAVVLALLIAGGCGVTRIHRATVVDPPHQGGGERDRWGVTVQLEGDEVLGTDVVFVGFDGDELTCDGGGMLDPGALEPGNELTFVRVGDEVDTSSPPGISGEDLRAECD